MSICDEKMKHPLIQSILIRMALSSNNCNSQLQAAKSNLIDLEEIVLNWAKKIFDVTKSRSEAKIKKKYLSVSESFTRFIKTEG